MIAFKTLHKVSSKVWISTFCLEWVLEQLATAAVGGQRYIANREGTVSAPCILLSWLHTSLLPQTVSHRIYLQQQVNTHMQRHAHPYFCTARTHTQTCTGTHSGHARAHAHSKSHRPTHVFTHILKSTSYAYSRYCVRCVERK